MYKPGRIIAFIVIVVAIAVLPFVVNAGASAEENYPTPNLNTPEIQALEKKECVESAEYMRANHMHMLDQWRDEVVRYSDTEYTSSNGQVYEKSLDDTCLGCHSNPEEFCSDCHTYSATEIYCWECHDTSGAE